MCHPLVILDIISEMSCGSNQALSHSPWLCLLVTASEIHWKWNTSLIKELLRNPRIRWNVPLYPEFDKKGKILFNFLEISHIKGPSYSACLSRYTKRIGISLPGFQLGLTQKLFLLVTIPVMYLGCEAAKPSAKQLLMSAPDLGSVLQPIWQQRPALALALKWEGARGPTKLNSAY